MNDSNENTETKENKEASSNNDADALRVELQLMATRQSSFMGGFVTGALIVGAAITIGLSMARNN